MEKRTAASKKIKKDFYVDNLITGTNTERSALQIYLKNLSRNVNESQKMDISFYHHPSTMGKI